MKLCGRNPSLDHVRVWMSVETAHDLPINLAVCEIWGLPLGSRMRKRRELRASPERQAVFQQEGVGVFNATESACQVPPAPAPSDHPVKYSPPFRVRSAKTWLLSSIQCWGEVRLECDACTSLPL